MRYGSHSVENYDEEHPYDERVAQARDEVARLDAKVWAREAGEELIDFRHRVEQSYDQIAEPYTSAELDRAERGGARELWIKERKEVLRELRQDEITEQRNHDLKVGGRFAADAEIEYFEKEARNGDNPDLNKVLSDLTDQQAARQEHITNDLVGPAMDAKLKELSLDQVKEPGPQSEPVVDNYTNAQHIPDDLMAAVSEDRFARAMQAYEQAGRPPSADGQTEGKGEQFER